MDKQYSIKFTQQELIAIFNVLSIDPGGQPKQYRIGDGHIVYGIVEKIRPLVAVETNIPKEEEPEPAEDVIIGTDADQDKDSDVN